MPAASSQFAAPSPTVTRSCRYVFADDRFASESDWDSGELDPAHDTFRRHMYEVEAENTPLWPSGRMLVTRLIFDGTGSLQVFHRQQAGIYDPSACGRISSIDASYYLLNRVDPTFVQDVSFLVSQRGNDYIAGKRAANTSYFDHVDLKGLHETDFVRLGDSGPLHPDFSSGPLVFGYLTANSCGLSPPLSQPCQEIHTISALADWGVTVRH